MVLSGKKSVGKSALARHIAQTALWHESKKTVLGFLLETTRYMWVRQLAGAFAPIDVSQPFDVVRAQRDGPARLERFRATRPFDHPIRRHDALKGSRGLLGVKSMG